MMNTPTTLPIGLGSASPSAQVALGRQELRDPADAFDALLTRAKQASDASPLASRATGIDPQLDRDARKAAEQYVATALIQPLLAQLNDSPFKTDMFSGGFGEQAFQQQWSQIIADRLVEATNLSLVDTIYNRITRQTTAAVTHDKVNLHG